MVFLSQIRQAMWPDVFNNSRLRSVTQGVKRFPALMHFCYMDRHSPRRAATSDE
jgi:hypothetical protein